MVIDGYPVILREKKEKRAGKETKVLCSKRITLPLCQFRERMRGDETDWSSARIIIEYFYHARFFG